MENNKPNVNVPTISDKIHLTSLVEKGDRKKFKIAKEFNNSTKYIIFNYRTEAYNSGVQ